jgi:hypothetical protein
MRARCTNPQHKSYSDYGGKGVQVCERWNKSFDAFLEDMGERPPGKTLGRIAPFADYAPGEVEWQTAVEQNSGLLFRGGQVVEVDGVSLTKVEWARLLGIKYRTLSRRLQRGWGEDAYRVKSGQRRVDATRWDV